MRKLYLLLFALLIACGGTTQNSGSAAPTDQPTEVPTDAPTIEPTAEPTDAPTAVPTTAAASVGKIGERVEGGGIALMVNKVEEGPLSQFYKPKGVVFIVDATLENVSLDEVDVNPLDFHVRDETGLQVDAALGAPEQQISLGTLAPGEKIRGRIGFDVPADAKGFIFFYDVLFGSAKGQPRIALDR